MITAVITNIVLEGERFRVHYTLSNSVQESTLFMPEDTAATISAAITKRANYFTRLQTKVAALNSKLVGAEFPASSIIIDEE